VNNETTYVPYKLSGSEAEIPAQSIGVDSKNPPSGWSRHGLPSRSFGDLLKKKDSRLKETKETKANEVTPAQKEATTSAQVGTVASTDSATEVPKRRRRALKPRKALITLSPNALAHLKGLLDQPTPQMIRIGVKNRGCSGLTYNLEYIEQPQKFDEIVEQDGVKVIIDSKALFSIVGSEMDWIDDKLSSRFVFRNPNSKGTCGCGESFMV
jgi:iron-sulfur cluster assembly protein